MLLQLPEDEVISHVARNHKFDPNFIVYCNEPGCGASYKKWSSFQKHVQRVHQMNLDNIDNDNIADVSLDVPEPYQDERNEPGKLLILHYHLKMYRSNKEKRTNCKFAHCFFIILFCSEQVIFSILAYS